MIDLTIVPHGDGLNEAARLIDGAAAPVASVLEPPTGTERAAFRRAVMSVALDRQDVAGVLFARRWGKGVVIT